MCQCLALTSLRDSHPLPTRHNRESVRRKTQIGGFSSDFRTSVFVLWFPYFRLRTSVYVLPFPYFSVFHLPMVFSPQPFPLLQ